MNCTATDQVRSFLEHRAHILKFSATPLKARDGDSYNLSWRGVVLCENGKSSKRDERE